MTDLYVNRWRKNGQDRLYVNLGSPRGKAVAWLNLKTGGVKIEVPEYESAARQTIRTWQHDQNATPPPPPVPSPGVRPRPTVPPPSIPSLPRYRVTTTWL